MDFKINCSPHAKMGEIAMSLFNQPFGSDVQFQVQEKCINAHSFVLKARSVVFEQQMADIVNEMMLIPIVDYMYENFYEFIRFIYTDNCQITNANGIELLKLAIKYKVVKLENKVLNSLSSVTWGLKLFEFCVLENYEMVLQHRNEMIAWNYALYLENKYFESLHVDAVSALLNFNNIRHGVTEVDIFNAIANWIHAYCATNHISLLQGRMQFDGLVKKIRFPTMVAKEIDECLEIFPVELDGQEVWNGRRRKHYELPYTWHRVTDCEMFETKLRVSSDVILCGIRIGVECSRGPFQIRFCEINMANDEIEDCEIEHSAPNYWDCVTIALGDSLVLKPNFEYTIRVEYSEVMGSGKRVLGRKDGLPVVIDTKYQNLVSVESSGANMLEMMFAQPSAEM